MALTVAVTGANGFVGSHVCAALLAQGHKVRACVRDPHDSTKTAHLQALPGAEGALTLFTGDLMLEGSYDEAFSVADAVVHTAAVVEVLDKGDPENKIVKPAVTGSLNVLASVRRSPSVARLVYLSSVAAVQSASGKPDEHLYTEADWNDFSTVDSDAYGYAKTTAERMLWRECASAEGGRAIELVTLCPGVILGPCLTKAHTKASTVLIREVIYGNAMQPYNASYVDVRDVAAAVAAAAQSDAAAGKRFIVVASEPPMATSELGAIAQAELPQYKLVGSPKYSAWTVWMLARVGVVTPFEEAMNARFFRFGNAPLKATLGVMPRPLATTVKDTVLSMIEGGWVKPKRR